MNKLKINIISIIIPHYDNLDDLKNCLLSIYKQKISNSLFEVIVIDDFSPKNPQFILSKFLDNFNNFVFIRLKKNSGPGIARNYGIKKAKGDSILFLDSDDALTNNSLKTLINLINRGYETITFNYSYSNKKKSKIKKERKDQNLLNLSKNLFIKKFIEMNYNNSVIFTLCKKSIFTNYNITFPKGFHEDIPVIFQIYYYSKYIYFEDNILYLKKNRGNSIVNTYSKKKIKDYFNSWIITRDIIIKLKGLEYYNKNILKSYLSGLFGLLAIVIKQNIDLNKNSVSRRLKFYIYICKIFKDKYIKDFNKTKLSKKTIYDNISFNFINNFYYKDQNFKNMILFEKILYEKNFIKH